MATTFLAAEDLLGVRVSLGGPIEIVAAVRELLARRSPPAIACAINVHTWAMARRDPSYRRILNHADLAFVDGVPIRWLQKLLGKGTATRIHGADLMTLLLKELSGSRHLFFGSTPEVLQILRNRLLQRMPGLQIAGLISPPFRRDACREEEALIGEINHARADIVWVGLGAPKQERWMELNASRLQAALIVGVGAAFEIHAGRFARAPRAFQSLGLEWAWRLLQDPGRLWRRYLSTNGLFLGVLLREFSKRLFLPGRRGSSSAES